MTHLTSEPLDGTSDLQARREERLAWLARTQQELARTIRLAPWLALSALLSVPAGLTWGLFAAVAAAGFGLLLPVVIVYLSWCHQQEYIAEEDTLRQHLATSAETLRASSARPWRVRGKPTQLGELRSQPRGCRWKSSGEEREGLLARAPPFPPLRRQGGEHRRTAAPGVVLCEQPAFGQLRPRPASGARWTAHGGRRTPHGARRSTLDARRSTLGARRSLGATAVRWRVRDEWRGEAGRAPPLAAARGGQGGPAPRAPLLRERPSQRHPPSARASHRASFEAERLLPPRVTSPAATGRQAEEPTVTRHGRGSR